MINGIEIAEFLDEERVRSARKATLAREVGGRMVAVLTRELDEKPQDLAQLFWGRAQEFTEQAGRDQRFAVVSYDEGGTIRGQRLFRIQVGDPELAGTGPDDGGYWSGNAKSLRKREYDHLEARDRLNLKREAELWKNVRSENARLAEEVQKLREENRKLLEARKEEVEALERLKSEAHTRELAQIDATQTARMKAGVFMGAMQLLPVIMAHLSGATPLAKFVQDLEPEQLEEMLTSLTPEQLLSFKGLMTQQRTADRARAQMTDGKEKDDA